MEGQAAAGQAPGTTTAPDLPVSGRDRVYAADQFSNTVSVIDPSTNELLGAIRLGDPQPANLSPLYRGQLLVHGLGFSPDRRTLAVVSIGSNAVTAVVSIGSNAVTFVETSSNRVKHTVYVGRAPHEAFFTPDGKEVWVSIRGEDYITVLDGRDYRELRRISVPPGPGMTIFSPDGRYGYVCSSFSPETTVIDIVSHEIVGRVRQISPFCPNIAAAPDGDQVWLTLKDTGKVMAFDAKPPFEVLRVIDTGPITNHVNFARTPRGQYAYVSVGGQNEVQVFRTDNFERVATIPVGQLPHGIWPSGDGTRMYVGLENRDAVTMIDTASNKVIATAQTGQSPQAIVYVPDAVPEGDPVADNLQPLGVAGSFATLELGPPDGVAKTEVTLFDQGLTQVMQAAVTGLEPQQSYVLALSETPSGDGALQPLASFRTNLSGAAIVNAVGPIRQVVQGETPAPHRYLIIATAGAGTGAKPVQTQHAERGDTLQTR